MVGSDRATPVTAVQPQPVVRSRKRTAVVFCGEDVSAGFALALAVMEAREDLLVISPKPDTEGD
jgi:hypothetical protein